MERTKMITIALIVGGGLLVLGVAALMFYLLISPENAELADVQAKLEEEKGIAAQLDQKETELEDITAQWLEAREELQKLRRTRSRPISIMVDFLRKQIHLFKSCPNFRQRTRT